MTSSVMSSTFYFIIALGILVFVHELGHFLLAKKLGVKVLTFSLGFGPKLVGRKKGETNYQIAVFPLGGFVKLLGENPEEEVKKEEESRSFSAQPAWKRALIVSSGPFFNFFLSVLICTFVNPFGIFPSSMPPVPPMVSEVSPGLPAEKAGVRKGDRILSVNGQPVATWEELSNLIRRSEGREISVTIERDGEIFETQVTPIVVKDGKEEAFRIGIMGPKVYPNVGPKFEVGNGFHRTWQVIKVTLIVFVKIFQGDIPAKDAIGGPIAIAQMAGQQARKGFSAFFYLIALLSVNLGIINLLPIPILDGGHMLFLGVESVMGKPLSLKKMEIAQQVGLILIILLMMFAFYNDLLRLFTQGGSKF